MTRTAGESRARALLYCEAETPTVTASRPATAMVLAISANAACASLAPLRQLSARSGHSIQHPLCRSNSAGIRKPSFAGVDVNVRTASLQPLMLALPSCG